MPTDPHAIPTLPRAGLARSAWLAIALVGLATAGFAGALIMKSALEPGMAADQAQVGVGTPAPGAAAQADTTAPALQRAPAASTAPAPVPLPWATPVAAARACADCGVVESVRVVHRPSRTTGAGAVAGGLLGALVGHQLGGGSGKAALTALGALGGGLAGNEVERRAHERRSFEVSVRMADGQLRRFERGESMAVGTRVFVQGGRLRVATAPAPAAPRALNASVRSSPA